MLGLMVYMNFWRKTWGGGLLFGGRCFPVVGRHSGGRGVLQRLDLPAVRVLDLLHRGAAGHAEHLVEVLVAEHRGKGAAGNPLAARGWECKWTLEKRDGRNAKKNTNKNANNNANKTRN